jgi:hypothetical protein
MIDPIAVFMHLVETRLNWQELLSRLAALASKVYNAGRRQKNGRTEIARCGETETKSVLPNDLYVMVVRILDAA